MKRRHWGFFKVMVQNVADTVKFKEINFSSSYSTSSSLYLDKLLGKSFCHNWKPKDIWAWLKKDHNTNKNNCSSLFTDIHCGAQQFP